MFLQENKYISYNNTKMSSKQKRYNSSATKILQNRMANNIIQEEEKLELAKNKMKELTDNFKLSTGKKKRDKIKKKGKYKNKKKRQLFKECVYDVFYESLILDDHFKEYYSDKLKSLTENVIEIYLEENNLTLRDLSRKSELLESLITLCEDTAEKKTRKKFDNKDILNEEDDDEEGLELYDDVDVSDDELADDDDDIQESHNAEKENVTMSLAEEIKQKVIDAVQQEKDTAREIQAEHDDIRDTVDATTDDIDHTYNEDEDEEEDPNPIDPENGTPKATTAGSMAGDKIDVDNSTDSEEVEEEYTDASKPQSGPATKANKKIVESARIVTMRRRQRNTDSIYKNLMTSIANKSINQTIIAESNMEVNMDIVMAESVMLYTLLETLCHMELIDGKKRSEMKKFSEALVHLSR